MSRPKISIIIRSFNEEASIERLLQGILAQTIENPEIILVDSGSTDRTIGIVRHYPVEVVQIDPSEFSFGRSLNLGCAAARGEFLVFISAHCYPVRSIWLERLIEPLKMPEVAVSYGKQRGNGNSRFSEQQIFAQLFPNSSTPRQTSPFHDNANAAIRRRLWKINLFSEELTGLEDLDFAVRAIKRGYHLAYTAEAEIIHEHCESFRRVYYRYLREAAAFKQIYRDQTFRFFDLLRLFVGNTFRDYRRALSERQFIRHAASIPAFRLMQSWGTYRGDSVSGKISASLRRRCYYPGKTIIDDSTSESRATEGEIIDYKALDKARSLGISFRTRTGMSDIPPGVPGVAGIKSLPGYYANLN